MHLVSHLPIPTVIALYSMSKPFHFLFNSNQTSFILACLRNKAPGADKIFPWHCYRSLCIKDPNQRRSERWLGKEAMLKTKFQDLREVPTLRWLQMVVYREAACRDILIQLAVKGLLCPPGTLDALKRMWFILDLPLNLHRLALMRGADYISDRVLERMTWFLLKLDMYFTDPLPPVYPQNHPNQTRYPNRMAGALVSGVSLRKKLLAERHLTPLWRVLRGWTWDPKMAPISMTRLDILRLWVRHSYRPPEGLPPHIKHESILGVPWWEVGAAGLERTGVLFRDFAGKGVVIADPSLIGVAEGDEHARAQVEKRHDMLYPHRRRIILTGERPRQRLLRPDELVIRECLRRRIQMNTKWVEMMLYGFCDDLGRPIPLRTEEEYLEISRKEHA